MSKSRMPGAWRHIPEYSRCYSPPLYAWDVRMVKDRKLKSLPPKPPDPHERLLQDIRAQPKLRPVKDGRLVVETSRTKVNSETESPPPLRKVIKPDFSLLLSSSFEESEEDSELDSPERPSRRRLERSRFSPLSSPAKDTMNAAWHSGQTHTSLTHVPATGYDTRTKLQRRHTIMVCESPTDAKHAVQELPPLEEEEEPSPSEEQTPRLQRGADSPLSGLPDHTLHNGTVALRNSVGGGPSAGRHQGALYRSEHRRSLTSGLTAIPENEVAEEGSEGGCDNSAAFPNRRHSLPASTQRRDVTSRGHGVGAVKSSAAGYGSGGGGGSSVSGGVASRGGRKHDAHGGGRPKSQPPPLKHSHGSGGDRSWSKHGEDSCEDEGDLVLLNASEMLHVSWKTACQRSATNSTGACQDCRPIPVGLEKRWQNPIECLSLTLEEVTHIRSVLTKAELESLISHSDLYNQVAKSKVCFTCKTTRFTLFGEWGTKCKFCKRTVCSKCMRKMHVPTEHFKNIPVYTLSPTPLTKEAQELIQNYVKTTPPSSAPSTTTSQRKSLLEQQKGKRPLKRSQSMTLPTKKDSAAATSATVTATTTRGPMMSICCDCKGMIMEIIRASKTSLAMLQPGQAGSVAGTPDSASSMSLSSPSSESSETSNC